jgi:alkylhydroperoxidase family enzyme
LGFGADKLTWVVRWTERPDLFDERERIALEYADAITLSDRDVDDVLFARVQQFFDDDAIVELTELIAWENASSKFNRALRIGSQNLWRE